MMKNYKYILLGMAILIGFAVMPAEQEETYQLQTEVRSRVVEIPPADLSKVEENNRELHELFCEWQWVSE